MRFNKNELLASILKKKMGAACTKHPLKLQRKLPPTLQVSFDDLVEQLEGIELARRCLPSMVVQEFQTTFEERKQQLMKNNPDDFDPVCVNEQLREKIISLETEKNGSKRKCVGELIARLRSWLEELPQHQEDAIFVQHPDSYVALWIHGGQFFAVRHGLGGTFSVMEVTKGAVKWVLTHQAFSGNRYRGQGFVLIAKYDRREEVENTTFEKIRKIGPGKWLVVDKDGYGVTVTERWVLADTHIPKVCVYEARDRYKQGNITAVIIPPGSFSSSPTPESSLAVDRGNLPLVVYRNMPQEHKCLENCFMSAIHYIGFPEIGKCVKDLTARETLDVSGSGDPFLEGIANRVLLQYNLKLVKNKKPNRYDPLVSANSNNEKKGIKVVIAKLRGRTGGINHAVCFVNDRWIFDANHPVALPLTEESLEISCEGAGYKSLYWSYRLVGKGLKNLRVDM
jgi:hypothetical protein